MTATDSTGNTASRDVIVNVTNVDEPGTVTLLNLQPEAGTPLRAELTDPDGSISGVTWEWSKDGTPITDATSSAYTPVDEEVDTSSILKATATYTDGHGRNKTAEATSDNAVQDADGDNKAPKFPDQDPNRSGDQSSSTSRTVAENTADGQSIGDAVAAKDCDAPTPAEQDQCVDPPTDTLTYSLEGRDKDSFEIDPEDGQLKTKASLDYETKRSYTVTVKATDPSGLHDTISVTITVTKEDEDPELSGPATIDYAENGAAVVATYTARDPERAPITWTLSGGDDDEFFTISGGILRFRTPPNHEAAADDDGDNAYQVTVRASDRGGAGNTATKDVTIRVLNVDEPGTVELSTEQPKDGVEITATLTDPDGGVTGPSWQWAQSSSRTGTFTNIRNATNASYTPVGGDDLTTLIVEVSDVGKYLRATVTYTDTQSTRVTKTAFFVSTRPVLEKTYVNTPPVFPDQNPDTPGVQNETATRTIPENAAPRTAVGAPVVATDMGRTGMEVLTYALSDPVGVTGDAALFSIDARGQIRVGRGTILDYETDHQYMVFVTATDPEVADDTITVTINVTNVDEAPTITPPDTDSEPGTGHTARDHAENTVIGTAVSRYSATDPEDDTDADIHLKWSLSGNDADLFCIGNDGPSPDFLRGELRFKARPDFEAPMDAGHNNTYNVTVVVTDSRGNTATRDVVVTVTNVDEPGAITLSTEQPEDGVRLSAVLNDPDGRATSVRWKWWRAKDGVTDPRVGEGTDWDEVARATSATYQPVAADQDKYLRVTVTYKDRQSTTVDKMASVRSANDVQGPDTNNKPPKFPDQDPNKAGDQKDQTREVAEDTVYDPDGNDGNVGDPVAAVDCDGASTCTTNTDNLTYSLGGTDSASFTIVRGTGQIQVADGVKLDYETKQTYTVTVTATDPSFTGTNPSNARGQHHGDHHGHQRERACRRCPRGPW